MSDAEARSALREWIVKTSGRVGVEDLRDDTPILEQRILTSLHVLDLLLFLEKLTGRNIDPERLKPGAFRDLDTICRNFVQGAAS